MAHKKEKESGPPEYIAKHKKLYHHATKLLDTASVTHHEAYTSALNKHLRDEKGNVDFSRLDQSAVQQQFVKSMSDMYVSRARQHFKMAKDLDEMDKELLMNAYVGATTGELQEVVKQHGKNLNYQRFSDVAQDFNKRIGKQLYASAASHLDEEHIPDIIKFVGLEGKVNSDRINLQQARALLQNFHEEGAISDSVLRQIVPPYQMKKKEEKEKKAA